MLRKYKTNSLVKHWCILVHFDIYRPASGPHLLFFHLAIVLHPIFSQEVLYGAMILGKSIPAVQDAFLQQYQDTLQA
jgi:hypothetical protein